MDVHTQAYRFALQADHVSFTGGWQNTDNSSTFHRWSGRLRGGRPGRAAWTGTWDVRSTSGTTYVLYLHQEGARVTGTLRTADGPGFFIDARAQGTQMSFREKVGGLSLWHSILLIAFVLIPACFTLVWLALPFWRSRLLLPAGIGFVAVAAGLSTVHLPVGSNFCKLAAMTVFGWWFLTYFEAVSWVVIVALLIPWVDEYSVWRGPTKTITEGHPHVFDALSIAFVVPGGGAARLGLPDVLFLAVFLGASVRFRLRPAWTFAGLLVGLGLTMILATWWHVDGLPALPGISLGFLLPNADLLWRRLRRPAFE